MAVLEAPRPAASATGLGAPPIATFGTSSQIQLPRWLVLLLLIVGQALLARTMSGKPIVALLHVAVIFGLLMYALAKRNTPLLLLVYAYLPASEIMWRQSHAPIASGTGPYLLTFCSLIAVGISYPHITLPARTALLYIGLLLPSSVVTLSTTGAASRELVVFALAGPITLTALVLLFSQLGITTDLYRRMLWVIVIGGVGPLAIALTSIADYIGAGQSLEFNNESNPITSGGFGPVQVSSLLGFTVLAATLLIMVERELAPRIFIGIIGIAAMTQSLLTFSRGGMFATAIALGGLTISQAKNRRTRTKTFAAVAALLAVGYFLVVPRLDSFTQGKFEERFRTTRTGRTNLATSDLDLFRRNMLFGVGPGMAKYRQISYEICQLRSDRCRTEGSSHTEFTRMPAEHGIPGVVAIGVMSVLALQALRRAGPSFGISLSMLLWAIAQMFYANLRVVAVPFAFAFAFLYIRDPDDPSDEADVAAAPSRGPPRPADRRLGQRAPLPAGSGSARQLPVQPTRRR
ncbi:MAG: O-antigen ligase family protein [Acidimicrobiales bacterium]|nr:O-antigen ligase family protein [Acidimicrobiales bacterium]